MGYHMNVQSMTIDQGLSLAEKMVKDGHHQEAKQIYEQLLASHSNNAEVFYLVGASNFQLGNLLEAESFFKRSTTLHPNQARYISGLGFALKAQGRLEEAKSLFRQALSLDPADFNACSGLAYSLMEGEPYGDVISRFHAHLKPKRYVEIGIETGRTLAKARPPTIAIGIDPNPIIRVEFEAETKIYPVTSNNFFDKYDLATEMGRPVVDFVFLDGLHLFEQTLKDFMNIEKFSTADTVVVIHDCLPLNQFTAARERQSKFWSGDPWKIIPCLKKYRPDLKLFVISTPPTGLAVVTGLNASSAILHDNWNAILDEYVGLEYTVTEEQKESYFNLVKNDWPIILAHLNK
jgi:tetratricopeptide (TPR) repeat protein